MNIIKTVQLGFKDVMIQPKNTISNSRFEIDIKREFKFSKNDWKGVPIIGYNTAGTFEVYDVLSSRKIITCFHKFYTVKDFKEKIKKTILDPDYFMISTDIQESNFSNLYEIISITKAKWVCINITNEKTSHSVNYCKKIRDSFPDIIIVAGNVLTKEATLNLISNGVKCVKIGPDSSCSTYLKTGVGIPQLTAIMECATAAHSAGGFIISDGGIECPGDAVKAFGGGADFVSIKQFANNNKNLDNTVTDYLGGIKLACVYINAKSIETIPKNTTFLIVSQ